MTYLLDSNTCIRFLNGTSESVRERMAAAELRVKNLKLEDWEAPRGDAPAGHQTAE